MLESWASCEWFIDKTDALPRTSLRGRRNRLHQSRSVSLVSFGAFAYFSVSVTKMADGDIDLYADDLEQDFAQVNIYNDPINLT